MFNLFGKKKTIRTTRMAELLGLGAQEYLLEARVQKTIAGIHKTATRRKAERAARRAITKKLEEVALMIVANENPEIILEIGAHAAEFSRLAKKTSPSSRCIAFEGNPTVHQRFKTGLETDGVEYEQLCISDTNAPLTFHVPVWADAHMDNMGSVMPYEENLKSDNPRHETYTVPATTLDSYLTKDINRKSLMWIDVEGAIGSVLAGAKRSLKNCLAVYAEVEIEPRWEGQTVLDAHVYDILAPLGFIPVLRDVQRPGWQYNVLYVHESIASRRYLGYAARGYLSPPEVNVPQELPA